MDSMKTKLGDEWICSICGAVWESYGGKCASCGAGPKMEELPFDEGEIDHEETEAAHDQA